MAQRIKPQEKDNVKHIIPAKLFDELNYWIKGPWTKDTPSDDFLYDAEVTFKDGVRLLIQVVGCSDETPYVQVVALDADGNEIGCNCDTSDTGLGGRYTATVSNGNREKLYVVDVVRGKAKKKKSTDTGLFCGVIPTDLAKNKKLLKQVNGPTFGSSLSSWDVIELFDNEVPKKVLKAIEKESKAPESDCSVYTLMWGDLFWYHGEDGHVLADETIKVVQRWVNKQARDLGLAKDSCYWFRIKRA